MVFKVIDALYALESMDFANHAMKLTFALWDLLYDNLLNWGLNVHFIFECILVCNLIQLFLFVDAIISILNWSILGIGNFFFNPWYNFFRILMYSSVFAADALVSTGLADLGYVFVNIGIMLCLFQVFFCFLSFFLLFKLIPIHWMQMIVGLL